MRLVVRQTPHDVLIAGNLRAHIWVEEVKGPTCRVFVEVTSVGPLEVDQLRFGRLLEELGPYVSESNLWMILGQSWARVRNESLANDRDQKTRLCLARSPRFKSIVAGLGVERLAAVNPMRVDDLTDAQHEELRRWATGESADELPTRLREFVESVG